jgi:hypothetical protein
MFANHFVKRLYGFVVESFNLLASSSISGRDLFTASHPGDIYGTSCMASQLYKGRLIVAEGIINELTGQWRVMIDITSVTGRQSRVLKIPSQESGTKEEAETFGVKSAQDCIDQER